MPSRNKLLVLHSSGITKRSPEIAQYIEPKKMTFKNDFREERGNSSSQIRGLWSLQRSRSLRVVLAQIFYKLGFVSNLHESSSPYKIKPWTISIRGHYTNLAFDGNILDAIWRDTVKIYALNPTHSNISSDLVIQYRLGDLINLQTKSFVSPELLTEIILEVIKKSSVSTASVFTDSAQVALDKLKNIPHSFNVWNCSPVQTIYHGVIAQEFIGTNSKISLWIAIFRGRNNVGSVMPIGFQEILRRNLDSSQFQKIQFYSPSNHSTSGFLTR